MALAAIALPVLYALEPFRRYRILEMLEDRIGHLAGNTDVFARELRAASQDRKIRWLLIAHNPANRQLMDMWKRQFAIIEGRLIKNLYLGALPFLKRTRFHAELPRIPVDWDPIVFTTPPVLSFTPTEEARGRRELQALGISDDDWFVCFHARDRAYLETRTGFGVRHEPNRDSYLNNSILNYRLAMKYVVERGGIAVRMGQKTAETLPDMGPRIIDYATRARSDFLDVYLAAKCRMFIGNNSGLLWSALIFNRPVALANICPFPYVGGGGNWLLDIPKLLYRKADGRLLTFPEIKSLNMLECRSDEPDRLRYIFSGCAHEDNGLEWRENSPEEIRDLCMDLMDLVERREPPPEGRRLQKAFNALYERASPHTRSGGISPRFALRHRHLIEPDAIAMPVAAGATQNAAAGDRT